MMLKESYNSFVLPCIGIFLGVSVFSKFDKVCKAIHQKRNINVYVFDIVDFSSK